MAPCGQLDEDQRCFIVVVVAHGGPRLEGSQQLSSPGDSSNQAWDCRHAQAPSQDIETGIPGKEGDQKMFEVL